MFPVSNHCLAAIKFALLLGILAARGAEPAPPAVAEGPVAVTQLIEEALAGHPELRFYVAEIAAARAARRYSSRLPSPEIAGSVGDNRIRTATGRLVGEGVAWSVSLQQQFEWPGRLSLRKAIANQDVRLAELGLDRFKTALVGKVRVLAYGLSAAHEKAQAAGEVSERLRALRDILVQRDPAGITPLLEARVIEANELTAERDAVAADLAITNALIELNQLRGVALDTPLAVVDTLPTFRPLPALEVLQSTARTNNFEIQARMTELIQQGLRVDLARHERYPAFKVGPTYSEENGDEQQRILGLAVSLPLPLWQNNRARLDAAESRRIQAESALAAAERELERQIAQSARAYEAKTAALSRWRSDASSHFREAAATADRHYRLAAVPVGTYVELQRQYVEAVNALTDTRREALEAAAQLEALVGLGETLIEWRDAAKGPRP